MRRAALGADDEGMGPKRAEEVQTTMPKGRAP
jgi:hypothetical protein